jgi:hypothetical protein
VSPPARPTTVVDSREPSALSVAVSRALFDAAPAVIVAGPGPPALAAAAEVAQRLGLPVLLDAGPSPTAPPPGAATTPPTPTPSASPPDLGARAALVAEVRRLRPIAVLAPDPVVAARWRGATDVPVVTSPLDLPAVTPPLGLTAVTVLVPRAGGPGAAAATATARAAGATVVAVTGADPRADPEAVTALAGRAPAPVLAVGGSFGPPDRLAGRLSVAVTGVQLPGGGQVMFPGRRLVALYGRPGAATLGVLGEQDLAAAIIRAAKVAEPYRALSDVPVVPAFEIIATTAQAGPGRDGDYSLESSASSLRPWVEGAGKAGMYVVLDLQPGRARLLDQARRYASLLRYPHVGLAVDPEWKLGPEQKPLEQIGGVDAAEINEVIAWLARLTEGEHLPQKLLVIHQFRLSMIGHVDRLDLGHDSLSVIIHMDGQGAPRLKDGTWRAVTAAAPKGVPFGWKNFYDEDDPTLTPTQTMARRPTPVMISYQ